MEQASVDPSVSSLPTDEAPSGHWFGLFAVLIGAAAFLILTWGALIYFALTVIVYFS